MGLFSENPGTYNMTTGNRTEHFSDFTHGDCAQVSIYVAEYSNERFFYKNSFFLYRIGMYKVYLHLIVAVFILFICKTMLYLVIMDFWPIIV